MSRNSQQINIVIEEEGGIQPEKIEEEGPHFLVLAGYKFIAWATYMLALGAQYGAFTTGLPPRRTFAYVSAAVYEFVGRFRLSRLILWNYTQLLEGITLESTARFLHRHNCCFLIVVGFLLYFIIDIAKYHQPPHY